MSFISERESTLTLCGRKSTDYAAHFPPSSSLELNLLGIRIELHQVSCHYKKKTNKHNKKKKKTTITKKKQIY